MSKAGFGLLFIAIGVGMSMPAVVAQSDAQVAESNAGHQQFVFAYRLLQRNENKLAIDAFDKYLSNFPSDSKRGDALYFRAILSQRAGRNAEAIQFLTNAPAPKHVEDYKVLLLEGQLYGDLDQHQNALASLEKIDLGNLKPEMKASILYMKGKSYVGLNNLPAAATQFGEVAKYDSSLKSKAMLDLANVQAKLNKPADAIETLKRCIALNDPAINAEAAHLAAELTYNQGKYEEAIKLYQVVMTKHTSSDYLSSSIVGVLWSQFQLKQYGQVLTTFDQYKGNLSNIDKVTGWYLAGASQAELGRHDQAVALFSAILVAAAGSPLEDKVLFRLATSQYEVGQYHGMTATIRKLRNSYPNSPRLADSAFLMASASLKKGDLTAAAAQLTAIVDAGQVHPYYTQALLHRAQLYESTSQMQPAANDYQTYVSVYKKATGQNKLGLQSVQDALIRLSKLNYRLGKYEASDQAAAQLLGMEKVDPLTEADALFQRTLALIKVKQLDQAHQMLDTLLTKHPQNTYRADALYYRGIINSAKKKNDAAVADLKSAVAEKTLSSPFRINALKLMGIHLRSAEKSDDAAESLAALEAIVGVNGLANDERLWMARYHLGKSDAKATMKYVRPILESRSNASRTMRADALMVAADALRELKDRDAAIAAFREVIAMGQGYGYSARLELARTLAEKEDYEEALGEYEGLINVTETPVASAALFDAAHVHLKLAQVRRRESDTQGADEQREAARNALKRLVLLYSFPEISPLPELSFIMLQEIAFDNQKPDVAKSEMNELIEKFPDGPYAVYGKAMLAKLENQTNVARTLLNQLRQQENLDARLLQRVEGQLKALEAKQ